MPITCLPNIWKKFGINPASRFYEIYGGHIAARFGTPDLTFGQVQNSLFKMHVSLLKGIQNHLTQTTANLFQFSFRKEQCFICFVSSPQLYEKTGRELCIVVTNLTKMRSEYCHPKTTPDVPIRLAVRMSMSFPGKTEQTGTGYAGAHAKNPHDATSRGTSACQSEAKHYM